MGGKVFRSEEQGRSSTPRAAARTRSEVPASDCASLAASAARLRIALAFLILRPFDIWPSIFHRYGGTAFVAVRQRRRIHLLLQGDCPGEMAGEDRSESKGR